VELALATLKIALNGWNSTFLLPLITIRSATRHFCSLFVQQMRSFSARESVQQTQAFSVLLAILPS